MSLDQKNIHHAYLLLGDKEKNKEEVLLFVKKNLDLETDSNPDFLFFDYESFGINEARSIKEHEERKPLKESKTIVISFDFITKEAQNALLKILEEPREGTYFFLITRVESTLLKTLLSRLILLRKSDILFEDGESKKFLEGEVDERLKYSEKFKEVSNETKKIDSLRFIESIERDLYSSKKGRVQNKLALNEIVSIKKYLFTRSPSTKMLMDYLAVFLPKIKNQLNNRR